MNWEQEQQRFMEVAFEATRKAAKRAFWHWKSNKRDDALQECVSKLWDSWSRLLLRGKNPEPMLGCLIKYALLWVRYDRRISGRARTPDIYDFRAGFTQQQITDQGAANPADRSAAENPWIDWTLSSGDDPSDLASALEETGVSLAQWCDC